MSVRVMLPANEGRCDSAGTLADDYSPSFPGDIERGPSPTELQIGKSLPRLTSSRVRGSADEGDLTEYKICDTFGTTRRPRNHSSISVEIHRKQVAELHPVTRYHLAGGCPGDLATLGWRQTINQPIHITSRSSYALKVRCMQQGKMICSSNPANQRDIPFVVAI
jgi:hypothetical protein